MEITRQEIIKLLTEKSTVKYKVYDNTLAVFETIKTIMAEISDDLKKSIYHIQTDIPIDYRERGKFELEMKVAADLVLMTMHSNVFKLPNSHFAMQSNYIKENDSRSYCGIINIYNFVADSFKYNRYNDLGYLIGRVFINYENHFFVEGKKQLGFIFNDFSNQIIDKNEIGKIINTSVLYSVDLDLIVPPLDSIQAITVNEMNNITSSISLKTGKKLGFQFKHDGQVED